MTGKSAVRGESDDLARLRELISAWDPYALLSGGAPQDEFDSEIAQIHRALIGGRMHSAEQLADYIAMVFRASFGEGSWTSSNCMEVAGRIWNWWRGRTARGV